VHCQLVADYEYKSFEPDIHMYVTMHIWRRSTVFSNYLNLDLNAPSHVQCARTSDYLLITTG
jgi:hypothetical protein